MYKPRVKATQRECVECGKLFFPSQDTNIYCSEKCRNEHNKRAEKEKKRKMWEENPTYCVFCGGVVPFGRRKYCSKECIEAMKQATYKTGDVKRKTKRKKKEKAPGIEVFAKEVGMSYGQYRARNGIPPEDIEEKYNAPERKPIAGWGSDPVQVHVPPKGGPARIKRPIK